LNELSEDERYIIIHKGTESPFSGKYTKHDKNGVYLCKQCDKELFSSQSKFDSFTGWPSFDDCIDKNVEEFLDDDNIRVEIICRNCKAHLGHVFRGENFTSKSTRHCVNSISLNFKDNH